MISGVECRRFGAIGHMEATRVTNYFSLISKFLLN